MWMCSFPKDQIYKTVKVTNWALLFSVNSGKHRLPILDFLVRKIFLLPVVRCCTPAHLQSVLFFPHCCGCPGFNAQREHHATIQQIMLIFPNVHNKTWLLVPIYWHPRPLKHTQLSTCKLIMPELRMSNYKFKLAHKHREIINIINQSSLWLLTG